MCSDATTVRVVRLVGELELLEAELAALPEPSEAMAAGPDLAVAVYFERRDLAQRIGALRALRDGHPTLG